MPARGRYFNPGGHGWRGGVVGGAYRYESGKKPWYVVFTNCKKVEKARRFSSDKEAKKWRKKYSDTTGRTTNRWRVHTDAPDTVEMVVGTHTTVLYDIRLHDTITRYVWRVNVASGRVYTTGRIISSRKGVNSYLREKRSINSSVATVSMTEVVMGSAKTTICRRARPQNGVIDNRSRNLTTMSDHQKGAKRGPYKKPPRPPPPKSAAAAGGERKG